MVVVQLAMSCKAGDCSRRSRGSDLGGAFRNEEEDACGRVVPRSGAVREIVPSGERQAVVGARR